LVWFRLTKANRSDAHVTEFNQFNWTFFISINHFLNNTTWLENQTNIQDLRKYFLKRSFLKTSGFNVHMADRLFKSLSILISTWTSLSHTHTHTIAHTLTHFLLKIVSFMWRCLQAQNYRSSCSKAISPSCTIDIFFNVSSSLFMCVSFFICLAKMLSFYINLIRSVPSRFESKKKHPLFQVYCLILNYFSGLCAITDRLITVVNCGAI
jgi:hypothetical protein